MYINTYMCGCARGTHIFAITARKIENNRYSNKKLSSSTDDGNIATAYI